MLDEFGTTYQTLGDLDEALKAYREGLAIMERLVADNRSITEWRKRGLLAGRCRDHGSAVPPIPVISRAAMDRRSV
jgi:hypothetical protein